jgi:hypothetical protein
MLNMKTIWKEVSHGENIDVYVTIAVASVTFILSVFGIVEQKLINSITLIVLCLLVISSLVNRHQLNDKLASYGSVSGIQFSERFPSDFDQRIKNANSLFISGVSLTRTTITYYSEIENKLKQGHSIKVLLVDPDGDGCRMALQRHRAKENLDHFRLTIISSIERLNGLKALSPGNLEIRVIDNPLGFGAYAVDVESASGVIYVENYPFKTEKGSIPRYTLRPDNKEWFDFFKSELNLLWDHAHPYDSKAQTVDKAER